MQRFWPYKIRRKPDSTSSRTGKFDGKVTRTVLPRHSTAWISTTRERRWTAVGIPILCHESSTGHQNTAGGHS